MHKGFVRTSVLSTLNGLGVAAFSFSKSKLSVGSLELKDGMNRVLILFL